MDRGLSDADDALRAVRRHVARALLGEAAVDPRLGTLALRPHQVTAVARLLGIIGAFNGALLGDAVGLGKTYVALAVARAHASALVICPAALRAMWGRAMEIAGVEHPVVSIESLSRGALPRRSAELLIVDEAHHLRTPSTRRYEAVARLAQHARMLLLSATPLQNSRRDLTAMLGLFMGSTVREWTDESLARLIVRRDDETAAERLPRLDGPHGLTAADDDDCVEAILALPPTVPAADEGVAHALAIVSLVHLWTSSRAALVASVRRRMARATALRDAVSAGHVPTAHELAAWRFADGALQLAFPLFAAGRDAVEPAALLPRLDTFIERGESLLDHCRGTVDPDAARAGLLRELRRRHRGERVVAFSQYANTVAAMGRLMRNDAGIAIVNADVARIASGPVGRDEVLAQFALGAPPAGPVDRIDLLLTTDLLSEGIDLRGASVIVHLDLPWNPARLEQRVGRARRIGSPFEAIHVYTFLPPAAADRMIELRRRLGEKVSAARAIVGGDFDPFGDATPGTSSVDAGEQLRARVQPWLEAPVHPGDASCRIAAATAQVRGWLAVVSIGGIPRVICDAGDGIREQPREVLDIVEHLGQACPADDACAREASRRIGEWIAAREATSAMDRQSPAKRAVLDRLAQSVDRAPRHRRQAALEAAQRARGALTHVAGAGAEQVLSGLAQSTDDDEAWLRSVSAYASLQAVVEPPPGRDSRLIALILLEETAS
jgi:superfamily II DNA or RNA helicase